MPLLAPFTATRLLIALSALCLGAYWSTSSPTLPTLILFLLIFAVVVAGITSVVISVTPWSLWPEVLVFVLVAVLAVQVEWSAILLVLVSSMLAAAAGWRTFAWLRGPAPD